MNNHVYNTNVIKLGMLILLSFNGTSVENSIHSITSSNTDDIETIAPKTTQSLQHPFLIFITMTTKEKKKRKCHCSEHIVDIY